METLNTFLLGVLTMCAVSIGLFFVRFWRASGDRLFLAFAVSFMLLGTSWAAVAAMPPGRQSSAETWWQVYLLRLAAYVVLIGGIWDKNRRPVAGGPR